MIPLAVVGRYNRRHPSYHGQIANSGTIRICSYSLPDESAEKAATELVKPNCKFMKVKAKTVTADGIELSVEVKLKDASTAFVSSICAVSGVSSAALVSYNGEFMS